MYQSMSVWKYQNLENQKEAQEKAIRAENRQKKKSENRRLRTIYRKPELITCDECINALDPEDCRAQNKTRICPFGEVCMEETRGTPYRQWLNIFGQL